MFGILLACLFILMNGFFVAAEFALVKVNATKLNTRSSRGDKRAKMAQAVASRIDRYLSVTQLGITLASLGLGWIGEPAIEHVVLGGFTKVAGHEVKGALVTVAVVIAFCILTLGHVLFGELVPKLIAIQKSEATALNAAYPLRIIYLAFKPLLFVLEKSTHVVLRSMGMSPDAASEGTLSEQEIVGILAANTARSPNGKAKAELVERVLHFADRTARHAMVPRVDVASMPIETTGAEAAELLRNVQYSRVILTQGKNHDQVRGYLYAKDFFTNPEAIKARSLERLARQVLFVSEAQGLLDVLRDMQRAQTPIAVVVDEYGGSSGIVTMEDLLEEIVGEIRDELDEEPARISPVVGLRDTWDVDARATMEELVEIGMRVEESEAAESIGSVMLEKISRLPRRGDAVQIAPGVIAEVTALVKRRIVTVRVRFADTSPPSAYPPASSRPNLSES